MYNFSNLAEDTTLAAPLGAGDLSMTVATAAGYPATPFKLTISADAPSSQEIVIVTDTSGAPTLTITRAADGTTAQAHAAGAAVIHAATAEDLTGIILGGREVSTAAPSAGNALVWGATWAPGAPTPAAHASTHAAAGSDPLTLAQSQVSGLVSDLAAKVPQSRTLTINGVTLDLSADRSWTVAGGVTSVTASSPLASSGGATPNISLTGIVAPASGGSGVANSGNLAWPSGGGTAALLGTANTFTLGPNLFRAGADANVALAVRRHSGTATADVFQTQSEGGTPLSYITYDGRWVQTPTLAGTLAGLLTSVISSYDGGSTAPGAQAVIVGSGTGGSQSYVALQGITRSASGTRNAYSMTGFSGLTEWRASSGTLSYAVGMSARVATFANGGITYAYALRALNNVRESGSAVVAENYGLYVDAQTLGNTNYAIYTNAGRVRLGDALDLAEITTPPAPSNTHARDFARDNAGVTERGVRFATGDAIIYAKQGYTVPTYTPSGVTTRRTFDPSTVTLAELADVVGTLIADFKAATGYIA